jgi:hypothetical protein
MRAFTAILLLALVLGVIAVTELFHIVALPFAYAGNKGLDLCMWLWAPIKRGDSQP